MIRMTMMTIKMMVVMIMVRMMVMMIREAERQ